MYSVEWEQQALDQLGALPSKAFAFYAELVTLLQLAPWSGESYNKQRPDANMRTHSFGEHGEGLVIYLILEDQRRVVVLRALWAG
jgi:mRNA-degrading endonuclease RelE of RelBE toxin-antitoxin system